MTPEEAVRLPDATLSPLSPYLRTVSRRHPLSRASTPMPDAPVDHLTNLGPRSAEWLADVGIHTRSDLETTGAAMAYRMVQHRHADRANANLLYALHGTLADRHWNSYSPEERAALRADACALLGVRTGG